MTYLKKILYIISILFIASASLMTFLFTTTPGLYISIKLANLMLPGTIRLHHVDGQLLHHFSFRDMSYDEETLHIQLTEGTVHWQLKALLNHQLPLTVIADQLTVKITGPTHRIIAPPFHLQVNQWKIKHLQIQYFDKIHHINNLELLGELYHRQWFIHSLKATVNNVALSLNGHGASSAPYPTQAHLQFTQPHGLQGNLTLKGDHSLLTWQGQINGPVQGKILGTLKNGLALHTEANWNDTVWAFNRTTTLKTRQGHLTIDGTLTDFICKTNLLIETPIRTQWQLTAHVNNKQAEVDSTFYFPEGNLKTLISAKGTVYGAHDAKFKLTINPGTYQLIADSAIPPLPFKGGDLSIILSPTELKMNGQLSIDQNKTFNIALNLPNFHWQGMNGRDQNIDGKLDLQINSKNFLEGLGRSGEVLQGLLQMQLTTKGTIAEPKISGELSFKNASLSIPKSGLTFGPIQAKLQTSHNHWLAEGFITSNNHQLKLKGQGDVSPYPTGKLTLMGDNFPLVKNADYSIDISPQLAMEISQKSIAITGNILVPSAELKPLSFSNTVSLSEDAVFVRKEKSTANHLLNLTSDVLIKMGQNVELNIRGLRGFLDGEIRIQQSVQTAPRAIGELTLRDGKYKAYGQDLTIDQGQLLFSGGLLDSPTLHIRAIRKFNDHNSNFASTNRLLDFSASNIDTIDIGSQTTVGIELSGRLNAHKIRLFSIPANLSQSDILSLLILGKPANQASKSGGQLLLAAISSMNLDSGTKGLKLISQLKQTLGIDFNVQNNNNPYNQVPSQSGSTPGFVVGKSLSKRLYVSYNIGLLQNDSNVLTLKYLLNKFFSIQVTTSDTGNGLDLLYTHTKD